MKMTGLILDIAMPGKSGFDVQRELKRRKHRIPIVFITAHKDETALQSRSEEGVAACLFKPFSDTALFEAIGIALGTK